MATSILSIFGVFSLVAAPLGAVVALTAPERRLVRVAVVFVGLLAVGIGFLFLTRRLAQRVPWSRWAAVAALSAAAAGVAAFAAVASRSAPPESGSGPMVVGAVVVVAAALAGIVGLLLRRTGADFRNQERRSATGNGRARRTTR